VGAAWSRPSCAVGAATRSVELARETIELVRTQYEAGTVAGGSGAGAGRLVGAQEARAGPLDLAVAD
jgi:hypothetical protein